MLLAYLGAALFLAGAMPLTTRHVIPANRRVGGGISSTPRALLAASTADDRATPSSPRPASVAWWPAVIMSALAAVGVLTRHGASTPLFATLVLTLVPLFAALAVIDVAEHRLPNRLTGVTALLTATGLALCWAAAQPHDPDAGRRAVVGAAVLGGFYLSLALLGAGRGMGLGDVKLAPSLGGLAAFVSWDAWLTAAVVTFLVGGLWGVVLIARGRGRSARMPFGPFMIAGTLFALCAA